MKNLKVVRHFIDADKLMKMGFICRGVDRNKYDRSKLVFLFDNTKELNEALNTFSKEALNKEEEWKKVWVIDERKFRVYKNAKYFCMGLY